jgi:hypothetical protein
MVKIILFASTKKPFNLYFPPCGWRRGGSETELNSSFLIEEK